MATPKEGSGTRSTPEVILGSIDELLVLLREGEAGVKPLLREQPEALSALLFCGGSVAFLLRKAGTVAGVDSFLNAHLNEARQALANEMQKILDEQIVKLEQRERELVQREAAAKRDDAALLQIRQQLEKITAERDELLRRPVAPAPASTSTRSGEAEKILASAREEAAKILSKAREEAETAERLIADALSRAESVKSSDAATAARQVKESLAAEIEGLLSGVPSVAAPPKVEAKPAIAPPPPSEPAVAPKRKLLGPGNRKNFLLAYERVHGQGKLTARDGDRELIRSLAAQCGLRDEHELSKRIDEFSQESGETAPAEVAVEPNPPRKRGFVPAFRKP